MRPTVLPRGFRKVKQTRRVEIPANLRDEHPFRPAGTDQGRDQKLESKRRGHSAFVS